VLQVQQAPKVIKDHLESRVPKVLQVPRVSQALQVPKVIKDHRVSLGLQEL